MKKLIAFLPAVLLIFIIGYGFTACRGSDTPMDSTDIVKSIPTMSYSIVGTMPHDTSFFTEGLEFYKNSLLESTGLYSKSRLVQVDPATGKILKKVDLDSNYFGEGLTVLRDTIYQLTYKEEKVFVYTAVNFKKIKEMPFNGQGWGLTNDGQHIIASNGSNNLYFYEPSTFRLVREVPVFENGSPALNINELEYVNGFIYANQWQYNYILKINPATGEVVARLDLGDLVKRVENEHKYADYLNGIAFNPVNKKFYVTGKNWPQIFEIQFDR